MRLTKSVLVTASMLAVLMVGSALAGCGKGTTATTTGEQTTTTAEETVTTVGDTTTLVEDTTTTAAGDALEQITAALAASDQIAKGFQITDYKISGIKWAGVIVQASGADDVRVVLERTNGTWAIVSVGSDLSSSDITALGAPQVIVDFLGRSSAAGTTSTGYSALGAITAVLKASTQIADNFTITGSKIVGDKWAGVVIHSSGTDDAQALLKKSNGTWSIVTLGSDLSRGGLIALAAPQSIADFIGYAEDLSDKALLYAKKIGGVSHDGDKLYLVVGASADTEAEAQSLLDTATPSFGDMQSYFIIQLADDFDGITGTYKKYVIVEAYKNSPSSDNQDFDRKGFPDLTIEQATMIGDDPIPVYEDQVS